MILESVSIELIFPAGYNKSSDSVADHVHNSATHAKETINTENQRHSGDRYSWDDHHGGDERDEGGSLHAACALGGEERDSQDCKLLEER